jgi:malto-oligosyltrehalose trehalohydrolase
LPFGATLQPDGSTRFRLWAPDCESVGLEVEGLPATVMQAEAGGWFSASVPCTASARYRYRVRPDMAVPDPAARAQSDDVHGPSVVIDPHAYVWRHGDWRGRPWHETVLYEAHVGLMGGFTGLAERLPELADLGVTAVELMPVADFPGARNWGYDVVLPFAPDRAYGAPDELKALIDTAHGVGIMVFLDVVYNHFGPDGNYLGAFASRFFRADKPTPWGAGIDFRQPEVRWFFIENALYWIMEYRFDGLRLDAVHTISDPDWLDELARTVRGEIEPDRHVHLVLEHDGNAASHLARGFNAQWDDDGHHALHVLLTHERDGYYADYADAPAEHLARCLAEGFAYQGEPSAYRGGEPRGEPSAHLPPTSFVLFLQNHDQIGNRAFGERLTRLCRPEALKAATALVLLSPLIPLIFMGEEWGSNHPFLYFTSYTDALATAVRDGRRREFARFPAFESHEDRLRIPDPNAPSTYQASDPQTPSIASSQERDWLAFYRELLAIRRNAIVPHLAGARALDALALDEAAVRASWRLDNGASLTIAVNLAADPADCGTLSGDVLFATDGEARRLGPGGELPPFSLIALLAAPRS